MNSFNRGVRNAFRNITRTLSIVIIVGISMGLSLSMLVAHNAVSKKIDSVQASVGNTITIAPAGFQQGSSANNALTTTALKKVAALSHVTSVAESLTDRLSTTGTTSSFGGRGGDSTSSSSTTSLTSPTTLKAGGARFFSGGGFGGSDASGTDTTTTPTTFSLPVQFLGTNNPASVSGATITLKSGTAFSGASDTDDALVSSSMASKNSLKVGSTFTAYNTTLTVTGIFTTSTSSQTTDNTVVLSLPALQRLTDQSGIVTSAIATVDSLDNLSSVTAKVSSALGSSADVTSAQEEADTTVKPLKNIETISLYSLIGAVVAGTLIVLLSMIMIVRERKREIGILKAIGASNLKITAQFMVEAVTLTLLGAVVGIILGVATASPITNMLVSDSSSSTSTTTTTRGGFGGGMAGGGGFTPPSDASSTRSFNRSGTGTGGFVHKNISNIHAVVGWSILIDGVVVALIVAVIASSITSIMLSRVRPAEVMRAE